MDIIEKVKNTVLEWTLKLEEEGVLGEGMRFSDKEKQNAKALPQTVNNYYGATNVINAPIEGMQIVSGNEHVTFSYDQARADISKIEAAISQEQLQSEDKDAALEMLMEIRDKIAQEKKPGVIKALLVGLKEFLMNAGSSSVSYTHLLQINNDAAHMSSLRRFPSEKLSFSCRSPSQVGFLAASQGSQNHRDRRGVCTGQPTQQSLSA